MTVDDTSNSREQRLAAALRANLRRRKQARRSSGQAEADTPEQPNETGDDARPSERSSGKA